ncbi:hypothetical protein [Halomonas piscis]|uniref:hypothetical protein n=1 Tax=Halomonas piscis TaxID=3031727 RepID=UPI00289AA93E|nr:hypothetical protein [Halomonas piscis]
MTDLINPDARTAPTISHATRQTLMHQLESYEFLLFEPMTQADLDGLHALYDRWRHTLGDSPEANVLCAALSDVIRAGIADGGRSKDHLKRAYMALFAAVRRGGE